MENDLVFIARTWEQVIALDRYCPQGRAIRHLHALVMTYLRGQRGASNCLSDIALAAMLELNIGGIVIGCHWFPRLTALFPDLDSFRKAIKTATERMAVDLGLKSEDLQGYLSWLRQDR